MRKLLFVVITLLIVALCWYLFIKPSDFTVNFKVKTTPGTVIQTVKIWDYELEDSKIIAQYGLDGLVQQRTFNDSVVNYTYRFYEINDSITKVSVGIKDLNNSLYNRITLPFTTTDFKTKNAQEITSFFELLTTHLSQINVEVTGIEDSPATYCAYISLKGLQREKAMGMMKNYGYIGDILAANDVTFNGSPIVEITDWNVENDSISYNFCFPIIQSENLPITDEIKYKKLFPKKSIHAVYNGNYLTSDRAWYAILAYARKNNLDIEKKPIEVFFNNPNMGGNDLDWKADIYLPVVEKSAP